MSAPANGDSGLPENYGWFENQVAGHLPSVIVDGKRQVGFLKSPGSNKVLKPKQSKGRGEREVAFYEMMTSPKDGSKAYFGAFKLEDVAMLRLMTAKYYGTEKQVVDGEVHDFLRLEDFTAKYHNPAMLDMKIGRVTYGPNATAEKAAAESGRYPTQAIVGCRILGYRVQRDEQATVRDKKWGLSFDKETIPMGLKEYFSARPNELVPVLNEALHHYKPLETFFEKQTSFNFIASSLLFIYEADPKLPINMKIAMIDFSHVFPSNGNHDENYTFGLESLKEYIKDILFDEMIKEKNATPVSTIHTV